MKIYCKICSYLYLFLYYAVLLYNAVLYNDFQVFILKRSSNKIFSSQVLSLTLFMVYQMGYKTSLIFYSVGTQHIESALLVPGLGGPYL